MKSCWNIWKLVFPSYTETESPMNSYSFHPLQESLRTTLCWFTHGGGRLGMLLILKRIVCF